MDVGLGFRAHARSLASAIGVSAALALLSATAAFAVDGVQRFDGSATDIGIQREPGGTGGVEYRIRGEFDYDGAIDLGSSTVTLESLLEEVGEGGAGELIKRIDDAPVVPLVIPARREATTDRAVFETKRYRPQIRLQLRRTGNHFEFRLKLDRGLARTVPANCTGDPPGQRSLFRHHFVFDDGVNPPLDVVHLQEWDCSNLEGFQLKAKTPNGPPRPTPPPGGTPLPPTATPVPGRANDGSLTASLVVNAITRNTGQADVIELDASDSVDRNGRIVRYVFESGDGRVQDGASPIARFTYAPGDYRARVVVIDNQGFASSASRSFSDK
ncbi:MAG TPA: PKD domain-containing protein [Candidatus Binatia bacterium]|nr:PKD domain-containing protein [Candidatus Binatia bacterium]